MPVVVVQMLSGRTKEQKRRLVQGITKLMQEVANAPADGTTVIIQDFDRDNWGSKGELMSDRAS